MFYSNLYDAATSSLTTFMILPQTHFPGCLPAGRPVGLSICPSACLSVHLSACLLIGLPASLPVCLSVRLSVYLLVCPLVCLPACLALIQSAWPPVCLSDYPAIGLPAWEPVHQLTCTNYQPKLSTDNFGNRNL